MGNFFELNGISNHGLGGSTNTFTGSIESIQYLLCLLKRMYMLFHFHPLERRY